MTPDTAAAYRHCRHCAPDCPYGTPDESEHCSPLVSVWLVRTWWPGGHCPACAEAERIAKAIEGMHHGADECQTPREYARVTKAADIARGEA